MDTISYSNFRSQLASTLDKVNNAMRLNQAIAEFIPDKFSETSN